MFSDRWWIAKVAAALLLLAALCARADRAIREIHPDVERVALFTDELRTKSIILWGKKVLSRDAAGFEIDTKVGPVRVLTPEPPPVGEVISAVTQPTGPRTLTATSLQINAGWKWKRPLNYTISVLTVLAYLWIVRDRFKWRIEQGVFRSRY
jgi:hypothetical protein